MKRLRYVAISVLLLAIGCAKAPPNLTPPAVRAFYATEVIHDLDRVRDAANDAHNTIPPLVDAKLTLKIVEWHEQAITVVHDAKDGWQAALAASIAALQKDLPPATWQLIGPYVKLVQSIVKEAR